LYDVQAVAPPEELLELLELLELAPPSLGPLLGRASDDRVASPPPSPTSGGSPFDSNAAQAAAMVLAATSTPTRIARRFTRSA
jgi:hypothetical protein